MVINLWANFPFRLLFYFLFIIQLQIIQVILQNQFRILLAQ
jgi:hypothetical protein